MKLHHIPILLLLGLMLAACATQPLPIEPITTPLSETSPVDSEELGGNRAPAPEVNVPADLSEERGTVPVTVTTVQPLEDPAMKSQISLIVRLDFAPLTSYDGTIEGLAATSPSVTGATRLDAQSEESRAYLAYADTLIDAFEAELEEAIPEAQIIHRYTVTLAGVSVILPPSQRKTLASLPGVVGVYDDVPRHTMDNTELPQVDISE